MFSNDNELKKYLYLISYAGIILAIILNLSSVFSFIQYLWQLIIPFIVGFCIAFILNIITNQEEKSWSGGVDHHCFVCCCVNLFSVSLFYRNKGEWIFLCIP